MPAVRWASGAQCKAGARGDACVRQLRGSLLRRNALDADREHAGLRGMAEYLEPFVRLERPGKLAHQLSLMCGNVRRRRPSARRRMPAARPGDAGDVGRAALAARPAENPAGACFSDRLPVPPAMQRTARQIRSSSASSSARAHRAVQRLVAGHAHRRKAGIARDVKLGNAGRLRGVQNERHACRRPAVAAISSQRRRPLPNTLETWFRMNSSAPLSPSARSHAPAPCAAPSHSGVSQHGRLDAAQRRAAA